MTKCRALPSNLNQILTEIDQQDAKNAAEKARRFPLLDLYRRLDVRHAFDATAPSSTTDAFNKMGLDGRPADLPYMNGETFRLDVYTHDHLACLFKATGYNREEVDRQVAEARAKGGDDAAERYLDSLRPIHRSIHDALSLFEDIRKQYGADGRMDRDEYTRCVEDLFGGNQTEEEFLANGRRLVENAHVVLGLLTYLNTPAPAAPDAGPRVVSSPVPAEGDGGTGAPVVPPHGGGSDNGSGGHWGGLIVSGLALLGLGGAAGYLIARRKSHEAKATPGLERPVEAKTGATPVRPPTAPGPRVVEDTTKAAKTPAAPDDIAAALVDIDRNASPTGVARSGGAPLSGGVTPENVFIRGDKAEAVAGVDSTVIRTQIVLTYRHFLSQTAREALLKGQALPGDGDLANSVFTERVNEMVDKVMAEYHRMDPNDLAEMWRTQLDDRGYIVRRGAPQRVLMSVCGEYIETDAARSHSPFAGGMGAEIRIEAERRAGETDFFEKGLREILREPARLGR